MDTLNKYPTPQDHLRIKYVASLVEIIDKLEKERSDADEVYTQLLERVDFGLKHIHSLLDLANAMIEREDDRINGVSPPRIIEQMSAGAMLTGYETLHTRRLKLSDKIMLRYLLMTMYLALPNLSLYMLKVLR